MYTETKRNYEISMCYNKSSRAAAVADSESAAAKKKNKFPALALALAVSSFAAQAHHQLYGLPQSSAGCQSVNNDNKVAKSQAKLGLLVISQLLSSPHCHVAAARFDGKLQLIFGSLY